MFEIGLVVFECSRQNHNAYGLLFSRIITALGLYSLVPKQKWRGVVKADFEFFGRVLASKVFGRSKP